jgi:L-asparagine transporter-like permease
MSEFERQIRRRREREQDRHRADRAVGAYIAWVVLGMVALVLAIWVFESTALVVVVGAIIAIVILWRLLMRSQR